MEALQQPPSGQTPDDSEDEPLATPRKGELFSSTSPPSPEQAAQLASLMPQLAGQPLNTPLFFKTDWKQGQVFTEKDDPDRTQQPWTAPAFVHAQKAAERSDETTSEELKLPQSYSNGGSLARVVRGVLSEQDCAELLVQVNGKGFTPALLNIGRGKQKLEKYVRD